MSVASPGRKALVATLALLSTFPHYSYTDAYADTHRHAYAHRNTRACPAPLAAPTTVEDVPHFELTLPTETFTDRLTLQRGSRVIELRHFGPSVTRGDAVVYLPKEGVLIAGDAVDEPLPFAYGCHVAGWLSTLEQLRALSPRVIVPGHGPVMHDAAQIDRLASALASIQKQAAAGVERGETLEELRPKLDLEEARLVMAGSDKMLGFIFRAYFAWPALASAYEEARGKP